MGSYFAVFFWNCWRWLVLGPAALQPNFLNQPNTIYCIDQYLGSKKENLNFETEMPCMFFSGKVAIGQGQEIKTIADKQAWDKETNADWWGKQNM